MQMTVRRAHQSCLAGKMHQTSVVKIALLLHLAVGVRSAPSQSPAARAGSRVEGCCRRTYLGSYSGLFQVRNVR